MGDLVNFPPSRRVRPVDTATAFVTRLQKLDPAEQRAMELAMEIVIVARKNRPPDPPAD